MVSHLQAKKLKAGMYRGVLTLDSAAKVELPFIFEFSYDKKKPIITIHNADERIVCDEIIIKKDSLFIKMPVFDTEFKCKITKFGLEGVWINHYRTTKNIIPFKAVYKDAERFPYQHGLTKPIFDGKWEVTFSPDAKTPTKAIGVFKHVEQTNLLHGTFLTETGDYRYLEGVRNENSIYLSAFDGSHAFLFVGELVDGIINGTFYSGAHFQEKWIAKRNDNFILRDPEEISFVKNYDRKFDFSFENFEGKIVSLSDKKFENKVVIVQLMGSWCPNCLDESAYLSGIYNYYKHQGLEVIALAFEKTTDPVKARQQVSRLKKRIGIEYEILFPLQTSKEQAGEVLPALNKVTAFPTTIFLNKKHQVVKVHTGFNGPATGKEFIIFTERTENLIKNLLKE